MKKFQIIIILTYLLVTLNTNANAQNITEDKNNNQLLKIGVLVPLSGKFKQIGESVIKSIQLALFDLNNPNIKIYPKDSKNNAHDTYLAAQELEKLGIKIVIGPIFFENLKNLNKINDVTFISLTNITQNLPSNIIAFGINLESQFKAITKNILKDENNRTILLFPESKFGKQIQPVVQKQKFIFKSYPYNTNPQKLTAEIEKITNYKQRKINLKTRLKILEKSELPKDKNELELLKQKHTLGKISFQSVIIADFGERLKSVLASFTFADVSNKEVKFFTLNQWFDETLFNEEAFENLIFPGIDLVNFNKFNKKYYNFFDTPAIEIAILAYDAMGLIYYQWGDKKSNFKVNQFSSEEGFKGLVGEFVIKNNASYQKLKVYKISEKKFIEIN